MRKITSFLGICLSLIICLFSCTQKAAKDNSTKDLWSASPFLQQAKVMFDYEEDTSRIYNAIPSEELPPIKVEYIDPSTLMPSIVMPLKGTPKVVQTHTNVRLAGTPKVVPIPRPLNSVILGKDSIPLPEVVPAKSNIMPIPFMEDMYKSTPVQAFRTKDESIYNIQYLGLDQGLDLPDHSFILDDSRGQLWFGWWRGHISRFDGQNLYQFYGPAVDVMEDSKGNIWMAGDYGLVCNTGQHLLRFPMAGMETDALKEDSKGNIWFANNSTGSIYRYDGQNFTIFKGQYGWIDLAASRVVAIEEDQQGHIWIATQGNGVLRYDGERMTNFTEAEGLINNNLSTILADSQGQLWFGTEGGLSIFKPSSTSTETNGTFTNYTKKEGLSDNVITSILEDQASHIWIATLEKGINRFDGKTFTQFTKQEGLSSDRIVEITEDRQGNIWAATLAGGINRLQPNSFQHFTDEHGLSENNIHCVTEDRQGNIWMGTRNSGVMKYDGKSFTHFTEKEGLPSNNIYSILEDGQGNMWFGGLGGGLCRFDGQAFTKYAFEHEISSWINRLIEDEKGRIWLATFYGKVFRLNPTTGQFAHFPTKVKSSITTIGKTKELWMIANGYAAKYDGQNDQFNISYQWEPTERYWGGFQLEDAKCNNTWIGNHDNLLQIKKNGQVIQKDFPRITMGRGLPINYFGAEIGALGINAMHVDHKQRIWTASEVSIAVGLDKLENLGVDSRWTYYDIADGLKDVSYVANSSFYQDSKNRLWMFSNNAGVTFLDLNTFELPSDAPKNLSLSHIDLKGQSLDYRNLSDSLYQTTMAFGKTVSQSFDSVAAFNNYPQNLELPYDLNHLTFHFTAIDWSAPHKIQYSYQMQSVDTEWSEPNSETKADYRNLPYGTHTFNVKAIGAAQVWSEPFAYTFTILPPWWHTWWAYSLYALLTIGTAGWYVQRLRQQIKQKQAQLDKELYLNRELAVTNNKLAEINVANSRFVPNDFLKILGKESLLDLRLGDQTETTMTILFADIRDYTTLSEKMTPEDNFKLINAFLGKMGPIIEEHGGFICQFLGDGIMALFNDNHELAVKAAIEMQQALQTYNKKRFVRNREILRLGIGLNTGKLMLGVVGDKNHYESSVISDAVNTASRMEGLTKIFGCGVIVSEKTLAEIAATKVGDTLKVSPTLTPTYRFLGKVKVKGKKQALKIYDFFAGDATNIRQLKTETKADFEQAIHHYLNREFGKAADILKRIAEKFPEDVATEYYLTKAVKYVIDGVDADWNGVEAMVNK